MHYILITDKQEHIKLSAQCLDSLMWRVYCLSFLSFLKCVLCMSLMLHSLCLNCASASLTASSGSLQTSQFKLHQELLTSLVLFVSSYFDTCNVFICRLRVWLRKGLWITLASFGLSAWAPRYHPLISLSSHPVKSESLIALLTKWALGSRSFCSPSA